MDTASDSLALAANNQQQLMQLEQKQGAPESKAGAPAPQPAAQPAEAESKKRKLTESKRLAKKRKVEAADEKQEAGQNAAVTSVKAKKPLSKERLAVNKVKTVYYELVEHPEGSPGVNFAANFTLDQTAAFRAHQELCLAVWGQQSSESPLVDVCLLCPPG
jgi:hypothetical protein